MYCRPHLQHLLGTKLSKKADSVHLAEELLLFLEEILPACGRGGSSASELGLLRNVLRSKLWQRELPNLLDGSDTGKGSLNATAKKLVDQILEARPMEAYLLKLGAGLLREGRVSSLIAMINALSDRLACEDGLVQWASSRRQLPLVPHILAEDLSDLQDLPEVSWMYETMSDYLETYFRLLRADCFLPLQKGIRDFLNGDATDMRVFRASVSEFHLVRGSKGLVASMEVTNMFKHPVPFPTRVLMPSNLVCMSLSEEPFAEVLWGRVAERPSDKNVQKKTSMTVTIEFLDDLNRIDRSSFISCLLAPPPGGLLLVESPVMFLSFGPVLRRLQSLTGGEHGTVPLGSSLLGLPKSAKEARKELPWSRFTIRSLEKSIESGENSFDASQRQALEVILTSTLSVVQGPPGTGKSFTGVQARAREHL
ncbi:Helicase required for RNAi-mediated heterochromatin assembly 1 [Durusdinium trenchii]|uniref:Helicase required for RNAi-mediated heterochromatin assembly 1 n=1 Tax=Durusdinium trenchii TaxID=1381693 RepID=A0ABP0QHG5_9DINO